MKKIELKEKINYISKYVDDFNEFHSTDIKIIIKGSAVLKLNELIKRNPNDIDICFFNNENLETKRAFIRYITKIGDFKLLREDDNLITIENLEFGKVEFILFEYLHVDWLNKIDSNLYFVNSDFMIIGKILMLTYVMSSYYPHNDKMEKIIATISDLNHLDNLTSFLDNFKLNNYKTLIMNLINNSTLIFIYYKYKEFLWWKNEYEDFEIQDPGLLQTFNKVKHIFKQINNDKEISDYINFNSKIIESFYLNFFTEYQEFDATKDFSKLKSTNIIFKTDYSCQDSNRSSYSINNFNFVEQNQNSKINSFILNWFINNYQIKNNKKVNNEYISNLKISNDSKWENQGILVNSDNQNNIKTKKILSILSKYSIPYKISLSKEWAATCKQENEIVDFIISIPGDLETDINVKINIINIVHMIQIIYVLYKELNND
ncbi:hypothetical protein ACWXVM_02310 [Mycoplasma sp. 2261]